jgi:hypothetical protein
VVNGNAKFIRTIRPIELELCELRSFRLSEDSNQVLPDVLTLHYLEKILVFNFAMSKESNLETLS